MKELTKRISTSMILGSVFWLSLLYLPPIIFSLILIAILLHIIVFEWGKFFNKRTITFWLITPFYPMLPFILLLNLNMDPAYHELLFMLFVIVSSHDTGSFLGGTLFGKHKIAPQISPSKTWEGFIGGYIAAFISAALVVYYRSNHASWITILIITLITCAFSLAGDLFESWLKRRSKLKDSGSILPGHGGFLDRFDGLLFAVIFFYFFRDYLIPVFGS